MLFMQTEGENSSPANGNAGDTDKNDLVSVREN